MLQYDRTTIIFHWLTAALIAVVWSLEQVIELFPRGGEGRVIMLGSHIVLGVALALVLLLRIVWRMGGGARLPATDDGWKGFLATGMHYFLYALVAFMIVGGIANAWVRGVDVFGVYKLVSFAPGDRGLRQLIGGLHSLGANLILAAAGLHAAAALAHHYLLKDGVLRRMLPRT